MLTFSVSLIDRCSSTCTARGCPFVGGAIHGQLSNIFVRVENDDVNFWGKQAEESDIRTESCGDTEGSYLNL